MKTRDIIHRLNAAIPFKDTWAVGEPYGEFNVRYGNIVERALYCVTPTEELVKYYRANGYDLLISHHPFVVGVPQIILHTALDCCEGGLNDTWRDVLGLKNAQHFDKNLGWAGEVEPITIRDLNAKIEAYIGHPTIGAVYSDVEQIKSIVVCSGLGGYVEQQALRSGADCYVLGESVFSPAHSSFKAMVEIGHTLSEQKPGHEYIKRLLPEIVVDVAPLTVDKFNDEVYVAPKAM